jgi:hypothetical protein
MNKAKAGGAINRRWKSAMVLALLTSACATVPAPSAPSASSLPVLPAASLGSSHSAQQIVRAAFADSDATMQCVVEITPQRMSVVALNALGLRLFSVAVEDGQTTVERMPGVPEQIQPERILSDIQLAYWPLAKLQQAYRGSAWQVSEPFAGTRRLKRDGRLIAEVHYAQPTRNPWNERLWLSNYEFGYSLSVTSQAQGRE